MSYKTYTKIAGAFALTLALTTGAATALAQSTTTPDVPNTGEGGERASNMLILGAFALVGLGGALYLNRRLVSGK